MSYGRPSKEERDRWAQLLGDEGRRARRIRVRIGAVAGIIVFLLAAAWVRGQVGEITGTCPDAAELREFWAKPASQVQAADRDARIEQTIRCIDLTGKTREQIQADLGDWTAVSEYKPARKGGRASFLVWSNGNRSAGVRVDFRANGIARSAQEYRPVRSAGSSAAS